MSFFTSGKVDTNSFNRDKLPCVESGDPNNAERAVYRVRITDFADHIGAHKGDRTQVNFEVVDGPVPAGTKGSHVIMHKADEGWKLAKARGEIAASLGAFMNLNRASSGLKVTGEVFDKQTRTVKYDAENGKVIGVSREETELPLVQKGAEAFLVVAPYFDKTTKKRKKNNTTGQLSVTYEFLPLSAELKTTPAFASGVFPLDDESPAAPEDEAPAKADALELALADGWKVNPNAPSFYYKKGEPSQLKEAALRAKYE